MEHIGEILRKQTRINTSNKNTDAWSDADAEAEEASTGLACPVCKGAKFVHPLLPSGKPDFGQVVPCRCVQAELVEGRQARLQQYSNLGSLARFTFDNLLPQGRSENPASQEQFNRAYEAAKAFAAEPKGWLVLAGPSGSGKTHMAAAIANYRLKNNHPVFYVTVPDLLDHLRATFSPNSEIAYDEFFEQVRNAPLLILDDLGAQSGTPWAKEKLEQLFSHRFNNQLPTVIVTIVPVAELEERIRSWLIASSLYQIDTSTEKVPALSTTGWAAEFKKEREMTFDNFDWKRINLPLEQRDNLREAFREAQEFAKSPDGWLVFWGENGCGKTHLAAAIVNYRYQHKHPALFVVVPEFLDHLRYTFSPESKTSYDQLFESVKSTPLLVLDDFGAQATTPWAQEKLYQVVNYRYNAMLPTVVTTSYSEEEIREIDRPIASRFSDPKISVLFHITAPHYSAGGLGQPRAPGGSRKGRYR